MIVDVIRRALSMRSDPPGRPADPAIELWKRAPIQFALPAEAVLSRSDVEAARDLAHGADALADLRPYRLERVDLGAPKGKEKPIWDGLLFGLNDGGPTTHLSGTKFTNTKLTRCRFVNVVLDSVDFTECELVDCDFRFASFQQARIGHAVFERCDMFGTSIQAGTIALGTRLKLCTLPDLAAGITGLEWDLVKPSLGIPAIAGEDVKDYEILLRRSEDERPDDAESVLEAVDKRLSGAANSYRRLSGYWNAVGRFDDANKAYTKSRRLDRRAASPAFAYARRKAGEGTFAASAPPPVARHRFMRPMRWLGLWLADWVSCFGQSLKRVSITLVLVIALPGFAYWLLDGVSGAHNVGDDFLFSWSHVVVATPKRLDYNGIVAEWLGTLQTAVALALVGLFGFVLGNVLRQSS